MAGAFCRQDDWGVATARGKPGPPEGSELYVPLKRRAKSSLCSSPVLEILVSQKPGHMVPDERRHALAGKVQLQILDFWCSVMGA